MKRKGDINEAAQRGGVTTTGEGFGRLSKTFIIFDESDQTPLIRAPVLLFFLLLLQFLIVLVISEAIKRNAISI